jgi:hypothetical protein
MLLFFSLEVVLGVHGTDFVPKREAKVNFLRLLEQIALFGIPDEI